MPPLPRLMATRYVVPLREGGSLPAVVETEEGGLFVVKFRGAGQGPRALIAEILVGELAREVGLPVPELALVEVGEGLGRGERDPEIQDLLRGSRGVNVGIRFLEGAFNFDPMAAGDLVDGEMARRLVWFDALVTNPDRTPRNPNLMVHRGRPWLIDHGAALFAHHGWDRVDHTRTLDPFPPIRDHVLLDRAVGVEEVDAAMAAMLSPEVVEGALERVPDSLLGDPLLSGEFPDPAAHRTRYREYLLTRLAPPRPFAAEAAAAHARRLAHPPRPLSSRR